MTAMTTDFATIRATVPEHSTAFMAAMSGGTPFVEDGFLFFSGSGESDVAPWLTAVAYPLADELPAPQDTAAFEAALSKALRRTGAHRCWLVGPAAPKRLEPFVTERDEVYILDVNAPVPARLRHVLDHSPLRVREGKEFTPAHRRLWTEFMGRAALRPAVRELYARTASVLNAPGTDLRPACFWTSLRHASVPISSARIPARTTRPTPRTSCSGPCLKPPDAKAKSSSIWGWASTKASGASSANGAVARRCPMWRPPGRNGPSFPTLRPPRTPTWCALC